VTLKVAIVDDEANARAAIRILLARCRDVDVVAECRNGLEAVEVLRWLSVDLLLLDVQMPGLDGFGVIHALGSKVPPTVFVTAFDAYALRAFEVDAIDYVLKPFDETRFVAAFERARKRIGERRTIKWAQRLIQATPQHAATAPLAARLPVPSGNRVIFLNFDEIDWIEAANQYVIVHAGAKEHLLRESLQRLAVKLPGDRFARIHRSHLINLTRVLEVSRLGSGDASVTLAGGKQLRISRRYRQGLDAILT